MLLKHLFIIGHLLHLAVGFARNDESLRRACETMKGRWTPRTEPSEQSLIGDTCHFTFHGQWTQDQEQSDEFCELYAPWRLVKSKPGKNTECTVEATLICDPGWTQMYGVCFQMPALFKRFKEEDAKKLCADARPEGAKIAFLRRKYIVGVWERFFRGVEQIWVRASETWEQYVVPVKHRNAGKALALAFTGDSYDFNVDSYSLIKVSPQVELQVLCEYDPPMTIAEINYIGRSYSRIYWSSVAISSGILLRTSSMYNGRPDNLKICEKVLKPFKARDLENFIPYDEYLEEFSKQEDLMFSFTHSMAVNKQARMHQTKDCFKVDSDKFFVQRPGVNDYPVKFGKPLSCDNMLNLAIVNYYDDRRSPRKANLRAMSLSIPAPMWCKVGKIRKWKAVIPDGWSAFKRPISGTLFAHKVIKEELSWDQAQDHCKKLGARLTGVDEVTEAEFVNRLILNENPGKRNVYIGGRKKTPQCEGWLNFSEDPDHECSQRNIFAWNEGVASEPQTPALWTRNTDGTPNPNNANGDQNCLAIIGEPPHWMNLTHGGFLDDTICYDRLWFVCGLPVKTVEV